MQKATQSQFTGQNAQFQNLRDDGIKIRSSKFRDKSKYNRKEKYGNSY